MNHVTTERDVDFQNPSVMTETSGQGVSDSLVKIMEDCIMQRSSAYTASLHERVISLPFYERLIRSKEISLEELLLHFVNNAAIFSKLETLVKTSASFKKIIDEDLFRSLLVEKDITFFIKNFGLVRPSITGETEKFIKFMEESVKRNPDFLLPLMYVQFNGLFLGRVVCNATSDCLKKRIKDWNALPENNRGISYWDFGTRNLSATKKDFLTAIDSEGKRINQNQALCDIAKKAFQHNYECVKSVSPNKSFLFLKQKDLKDVFAFSKKQKIIFNCLILVAISFILKDFFN